MTQAELEPFYVPASAIRQYYFCPQIPYLNYVLHIAEPETESMKASKEAHERFRAQWIPRKYEPVRIVTKVYLRSDRLRMEGLIDAVVETKFGELIPCEFKLSASYKGRALRKDRMQLVACAMLAEDQFGSTVKRGLIYYAEDGRKVEVRISESDRWFVKRALVEILRMVEQEERPSGANRENCHQCWYRHACRL